MQKPGSDQFGIYFVGTLTVTDQSNKTTTLAIAYAITSAIAFSQSIYTAGITTQRDILNAGQREKDDGGLRECKRRVASPHIPNTFSAPSAIFCASSSTAL